MRWNRLVARALTVTLVATQLTVANAGQSQAIEPAPEDPAVDLRVDYPEPMKQPASAGTRIRPPASEATPPTGHAVTGAMPSDDEVPAEGWTPYEHWKHNGDGTVTTESYLAPKFRPKGAQWVPVDPTVRASSRAELPFEAAGALHPVRFGNAAARLLRLDLDGGPVTVKARDLAIGRPTATGRDVRYSDVATHTDLEYGVSNRGLVKRIVMRSPLSPRSYTFRIDDPTNRLGGVRILDDGSARFANEIAEGTHLTIPAPFAYEEERAENGMIPRNPDSASMSVVKSGNGYDVTVEVDPTWLAGKRYPIVLDPQLVYDGNVVDASHIKSTRDCGSDGGGCAPNTSDPIDGAGTYTDTTSDIRPGRSLFKFSTSSIPKGSRVDSATISLWRKGCLGNPASIGGSFYCDNNNYTLQFGRMNGPWDSTYAWRDMPGHTVAEQHSMLAYGTYEYLELTYDISGVVAPWIAGTSTNHGMVYKLSSEPAAPTSIGGPVFESSNTATAGHEPRVVITYSPKPNAPTNVALSTPSNTSLTATWTAPASNGGPAVSSYDVKIYRSSDNSLYTSGTCAAPCTSKTFSSLAYGTYYAKVYAINSIGTSPASAASPPATLAAMGAPVLTKTVTPSKATYARGEQLTYVLRVTNSGPQAMSVSSILDAIPAELSTKGTAILKGTAACGTLCSFTAANEFKVNAFSVPAASSVDFTYNAVAVGGDRLCEVVTNTATATNSVGSDTASKTITICDAALGVENWWSYVTRPVSAGQDARVNVANGNLVIQATDSTPIQARGRLGYVLRRTYNSLDNTIVSFPGSIGAGWMLNIGQADDLADEGITATGLHVPAASSVTNKLGVTLIDRDGTRHVFTQKGLTTNIDVTALATGTNSLSSLTPLALKLTTGYNRICVDATYKAPPGVHLGLWRYIAVNSTTSNCTAAAGTTPLVLGFGAERPDRMRYEFSATGRTVSMVDGSGVELRYLYESEPLPGVNVGKLTAVYEPRSCTTTGAGAAGIPSTCRAFRFSYPTNEVSVTDPAGRVTRYLNDGAVGAPRLTKVINPDGSDLEYTYTPVTGTGCGATGSQICTAKDTRDVVTSFGYEPAALGRNRIVSLTDRLGTPTTFTYDQEPEFVTVDRGVGPDAQRRRFTNIDASGRVGEILEGDQSDVMRRQTHYYWDETGKTCREPDDVVDNNLCRVVRRAVPTESVTPATAAGAADAETSFVYNAEGMALAEHQENPGRTPARLSTTWGYHAQYVQSSGTPAEYTDSVAGSGNVTSTGTARETSATLFAISDRTQMLTPRGNAAGTAWNAYLTTYDVADTATAKPNIGTTAACATRNTGVLCSTTGPAYSDTSTSTVTTYNYDAFGQRTQMITPQGTVTGTGFNKYTYVYFADTDLDLSGNVSAGGWLRRVSAPEQNSGYVAFGYDRAGNVVRTWDRNATYDVWSAEYPGTKDAPHPGYSETRYSASANPFADPWRYVRAQRDPLGNTTTYTVDTEGNARTIRPPRGNAGAGSASYDVVNDFDEMGNPTSILLPEEAPEGKPTLYAYDAYGNRTSVTDPNGSVATTRYDSVNRGVSSAFTRGVYPTDPAELGDVPPACRKSTVDDEPIPEGRILCDTSMSFNGLDDVTSTSDADDQVTTMTYDNVHREIARVTPRFDGTRDTVRTEQLHDADGNVTTLCSPRELDPAEGSGSCTATGLYSTHQTYDKLGRVTATTTYRAPSTDPITTTIEYDADGNAVKTIDANGHATTATYDMQGRRQSLTVPRANGIGNTTVWKYDPVGNIIRVTRPTAVDNGDGSDGDLVVDGATNPKSNPFLPPAGKQYRTITLTNGGWVAATSQRAGGTGRLELRVLGTVSVCATCGISAEGTGPLGGAGGTSTTGTGEAGSGLGGGAGGGGGTTVGGGGGGGGHIGAGYWGTQATGGGAAGKGGSSYGTGITGAPGNAEMGSGGGGGGRGGTQNGGRGADGGGFLRLIANEVVVENGGVLTAAGGGAEALTPPAGGGGGGGGGGGSGGGLWVTTPTMRLKGGYTGMSVDWGFQASAAQAGGPGYHGRIRVDAAEIFGLSSPTSGSGEYMGGGKYERTELGLTTLYSYDANNRVVDTVEGATSFDFAQAGAATTDGGSNIRTRQLYDADGKVAAVYGPGAFATSVTDPDERYLTRTDFDRNGNPTKFYVPRYDGSVTTDPALGSTTQTTQCPYDPTPQDVPGVPVYPGNVGVCVTSTQYDNNGNRLSVTRPDGNNTSFGYTEDGLLSTVEIPNPSDEEGEPARVAAQTHLHDASGRVVRTADALDHKTVTSYTSDGLQKSVTAHPNGSVEHVTTMAYDANGNTVKQTVPITLDGDVQKTNVETLSSYYSDGLLKQVSAPSSSASSTQRDVTKYTYDDAGNTVTVASPSANAATAEDTNPNRLTSTFTYTHDNLVLTQVQPVKADGSESRRTKYTYDPAARKIAQAVATVDATGAVVASDGKQSFSYYPSDREAVQVGRDDETITTIYDPTGNPTSVGDSSGGTINASFYLDGLVRSVGSGGRTSLHTYDGSGNRAARADVVDSTSARTVTSYTHNASGLPSGMTSDLTTGSWGWKYDKAGRLVRENQPNGNHVVVQNNPDNTIASVELFDDTVSRASYGYTYDEAYRQRTQTHTATAAATGAVVSGTQSFAYYQGGQLKSYGDGTTTKAVTWDSDGNRLTFGDATYTYNVDGSIKTSKDSPTSPTRTYEYEVFGGIADDGCVDNLYDGFDRLTRATGNGTAGCSADRTDYTYDGLDRQISNTAKAGTANAVVTTLQYDGNSSDTAVATENGTDVAYVLSPLGGPRASVKRTAQPQIHVLTDDGGGSITLAHDGSGAVACTARFDPYGTPLSPQTGATHACSSGATHNEVFYKGARRDQSTGSYQLGSRTYDPAKGSFLQPDSVRSGPAGENAGLGIDPLTRNRYAYVNGDPVNLVDPSGHGFCWKVCGAVKAVASVVVDTVQTTVDAVQWTYDKVESAVEYVTSKITGFVGDRIDDVHDSVRAMRAAAAKVRDLAADGMKVVKNTVVKTVKTVGKAVATAGKAVVSGVSYCLGKGARTCAAVAGGVALLATGVGAIAGSALLAGTALAGAAGTIGAIGTAATIASGAFSLISYKNTGNVMDLLDAGLAFAGPLSKGLKGLNKGLKGLRGGGVAKSCPVNSFTGDTPVLMADGEKKPISEVRLGDEVLATDPETGESGARLVTDLIVHGGEHEMVDVTLADGSTVTATDKHPFWNAGTREYVNAEDLEAGEKVLVADGAVMVIDEVRIYSLDEVTAYNLTVDDIHTYYAGETPVLVHNASCSRGLLRIFSEGPGGSVRGRAITAIRATLREEGFVMRKARGFGYLFENSLGEQVRIMRRNGLWDLRAQLPGGNYLDEFGKGALDNASAHGINVVS